MNKLMWWVLAGSFAASGCTEPCWFELAVAESTRKLFVVHDCEKAGSLVALDLDQDPGRFKVLARGSFSRISLGANEDWIAATTELGRVEFFNISPPATVSRSNPLLGNAGEIATTPDAAAWVAEWGAESGLGLIDVGSLRLRAFIPMAGDPVGLTFLAGENAVLAVSSTEGTVSKFHAARFEPLVSMPTTGALDLALLSSPPRVALLEDLSQRISVRDLGTLETVRELATGAGPRRLVSSADGRTMAVSERGSNVVRVFDAVSLEELRSIALESAPEGIALTDDRRAIVALAEEDAVVMFDIASGMETRRIEF
jgi:hypothetical protein